MTASVVLPHKPSSWHGCAVDAMAPNDTPQPGNRVHVTDAHRRHNANAATVVETWHGPIALTYAAAGHVVANTGHAAHASSRAPRPRISPLARLMRAPGFVLRTEKRSTGHLPFTRSIQFFFKEGGC